MNNLLLIGAAALIYAAMRKKKPAPASAGGTQGAGGGPVVLDHEAGLASVLADYGADVARMVERVYRLETSNFTSGGYRNTGAAGQKAAGSTPTIFPFGWSRRGTVAADFNPVWYAVDAGEGGAAVPWVSWKKASKAMDFLAKVLIERQLNPGAWNSTDPAKQSAYTSSVNRMPSTIVDGLTR